MTPERYQEVQRLFQSALECDTGRRLTFLAEACADDEELREEVESLLAHDKVAAAEFIEESAFDVTAKLLADDEARSFQERRIGPYKISKEIGRGGMGVVYLAARDDDQYHKQVAIKLVKRGMDTDAVIRRFRNERQILASLDHPNIARLIDGGTTDGLPYFVMDYVEGLAINEYCDEHKLNITERLKLFRTVCSAIHYAHQHLVIHRDIKPGNILVTEERVPKLLDFGIAKLLNPESPQTLNYTATEFRVMTPEYASPEQIKGGDVSTSTDVYSLGVLLYELLTGHRPYLMKRGGADELARVICEEDPDNPSAAVSRTVELSSSHGKPPITITPESVSSTRDDEPAKLRRRLAGDLDHITLMALRKEPQRRYASVEQFSEDIRRHLEGLPVIAHKDTFTYRSAKFVRRHKVGMAAAMVIALTLISGLVVTIWQAKIASRQAKVATEQRDRARIETAKAQRINQFLQNMFASADPSWYSPGRGQRGEVKVIDVLKNSGARLDTEMKDQPEVGAELHHTIGSTYLSLGYPDLAAQHFRSALELYQGIYGEKHPKVAENFYYLGATFNMRGDAAAAEPLFRQAITMMRAVDPENANLPYMLEELGGLLVTRGDTTDAEPLLREALAVFRQRYGEDHPATRSADSWFATLYEMRGNLDQAEAIYRNDIERLRRSPDGQAMLYSALAGLAEVDTFKGQYSEAESLLREALDDARKSLGDNHPAVGGLLLSLAELHYRMQSYQEAEKEIGSALENYRRLFPEDHPSMIQMSSLLSLILARGGHPARAEVVFRKTLSLYTRAKEQGAANPYTPGYLGEYLTIEKRYAEAEPLLIKNYNDMKASAGERSPRTNEARARLLKLYDAWKKPEAANYR